MDRNEGRAYWTMGLLFFLVLSVLTGFNIWKKDETFSEAENRILEQMPNLDAVSISNGRYGKKFEAYLNDQFIFRDKWIELKTFIDGVLGKRESNGVYRGKNGYLLEKPAIAGEDLQKNLDAINSFAERNEGIGIYFLLAPNAVYILEDALPPLAPVADQGEYFKQIETSIEGKVSFINVVNSFFEHKEEYLYYRTDHHWTSLGAYYAFLEAAAAMNFDSTTDEYLIYPVTRQFEGTLSSKSGYRTNEDSISIYINSDPDKRGVLVEYVEEKEVTTSLYKSEMLDKKDKYALFFGGNYPLIEIQTLSQSDRKLLILKDSYANCFVPFLTSYFKEIDLIDPRYYYEDLKEQMENKQYTDILFLYNLNTFLEDTSLYSILEEIEK